MSRKFKKVFAHLIFLSLFISCFVLSVPALAVNTIDKSSSQVIDFDYYYDALRAEYAKYNIDFVIEQPNLDFVYTLDLLENQLEIARSFCEGLTVEVEHIPNNFSNIAVQPYVMVYPYSWSTSLTIKSNAVNVPAYLTVDLYCTGEVDSQNGVVISRNAGVREKTSVT